LIVDIIESFHARGVSLMRFFAVPLGHKVLAVLLAVAVALGLHAWFRHNAAQSASAAELSFDPDAAQRIDPALAGGNDPAVAIAQSMLTDQVVAGLSKQAYLSAADMTSRMGEFRTRLELTQPAAHTLDIRFQDPDPAKSVETENAVANALAWGTPASSATTPPPVLPRAAAPPKVVTPPRPAAPPQPTPTRKPAQQDQNAGALATSLGQLQADLSSTNRKLEELGSSSGGSHRGAYAYRRAYSESEQQQLIKAQVREAEKKVQDLRAQNASDAGTKDRLAAIQGALSSILSAGGGGRYRLSAGISASRLREERAELNHAISVVESERQAIQREAASRPTPAADEAAQTPPASTPAPAPPTPPASTTESTPSAHTPAATTTESDLPAQTPGSTPAPSATAQNPAPAPTHSASGPAPEASVAGPSTPGPFRLVRLAGSAPPTLWWPAALAGLVCGLLYWSVAAWPSRVEDEAAYAEETPHYGARFITPDVPVAVAPPLVNAPEKEVVERVSYKRAVFTYEEPPTLREKPASTVQQPASRSESPLSAAPYADEKPLVASERTAVIASEEPAPAAEKENVVQMADPWADLMKKALAETEIGRIFEGAPDREKTAPNEKEDRQRSARPDRLAG
jgi:hypothetical protein